MDRESPTVVAPVLRCRRMVEADIEPAVRLLTTGFPERRPAYWRRALGRLMERVIPEGRPRLGFVMTDRDRLVGIILVLFAETDGGTVRGNVSSWYVESPYRGFSHLLLAPLLKLKDVTLINISPAAATIATVEAQGFRCYASGTFVALPILARAIRGARVQRVAAASSAAPGILVDHAGWGCLSFEVAHEGVRHPFVFVRRRFIRGRIPCVQLLYCRDVADFVRFARPLGRALLLYGISAVLVDANGPLEGVPGQFRASRSPKFARGADTPRIGDLSYTELAIFGS